MFLLYLHHFVYKEGVSNQFNPSVCIRMENFVLADSVRYSSRDYAYIKNVEITKQKKLRVDGYIVYRVKPFLKEMEQLLKKLENLENEESKLQELVINEKIRSEIKKEMDIIRKDTSLYSAIFERPNEFIEEKNQEILAIFFLKYLEMNVYFGTREYPDKIFQKFVAKIENYVVFHLENSFCLTKSQKKTYELALGEVAKRMISFVNREGNVLLEKLKDLDTLVAFKKTKKFKMIEESENTRELPNVYSEIEIKENLKFF